MIDDAMSEPGCESIQSGERKMSGGGEGKSVEAERNKQSGIGPQGEMQNVSIAPGRARFYVRWGGQAGRRRPCRLPKQDVRQKTC